MILRYAANLKLAKELYTASKPKLKGDQEMKDTFQNVFGLPESSVKLAGTVEAAAAAFMLLVSKQKLISFRFNCYFRCIKRCCLQTL